VTATGPGYRTHVDLGEIFRDVVQRGGELATRLMVAVVIAALIVGVGRLLRPVVDRRLQRRGRPSHTRVFGALFTAVVVALAVLLALTLAFPSVRMVDVLASLGIVSVAVGFAFKDVLENLLAGVLLLLRDPFQSGDQIRVGDYEGTVEGVTIRETLLRTPEGQRVLLPNAQVYTSALEVLTHYSASRLAFAVELDAGADLDTARTVAEAALREARGVLPDPPPQVLVTDVGAGTVILECRAWAAPQRAAQAAARDTAIPAVLSTLVQHRLPLAADTVLLRDAPARGRDGGDHGRGPDPAVP
jgi:small conductance mechanosensitive channel